MQKTFIDYMINRLGTEPKVAQKTGKVITISRETGCNASTIAEKLIKSINNSPASLNEPEWIVISKEILEESAKQLHVKPEQINYVFKTSGKSAMDEIFGAFTSKYYKNDKTIRKTISKVILDFAEKGNVIIIGRGGAFITKDIPKALHVNLYASETWRTEQLAERLGKSLEEAKKIVVETDLNRKQHLESLSSKPIGNNDFDLLFNAESFTNDQITQLILDAARAKMLV
ncbi:MAG TPA: hypothetical protein DCQ31_06010 [Bacteroidales bacterium]|nr:hypothetical protein [Bacteroidales bacterium]